MESGHMFRVLCVVSALVIQITESVQVKKYPLLMPDVHPDREELYLCTPIKVVPEKSYYIVGFEPKASMDTAHHMLLYGCSSPGTNETYWDCGEMARAGSRHKKASPCEGVSHVIYAWARNAKELVLPEDVGFQVGQNTDISYLVLQVHYAHVDKFRDGSTDDSGMYLMYTEEPRKKLAGVLLLGTGGIIPPMSVTHMETNCEIKEDKVIYPFAYRTHTHSLGKVVSGYRVREDQNGEDSWTLLGKRNPLTPQMFYPVFNTEPIVMGDKLAARCTMESHRSTETHVGPTNADEMCNFYLMYYVEGGTPLDLKYCFTNGPPLHYWKNPINNLNHIPNKEASTL